MNTKVTIAGVELKNPVMTASGTFGSGAEFSEFYDLGALGAVGPRELPMCRGRAIRLRGSQRPEVACSMPSVFRIRELMCL